MSELSHLDKEGKVKMVDISEKSVSERVARASVMVELSDSTIEVLKKGHSPKGDPLEVSRIAGIMGAKKTPELIPLCHQIDLSKVDVMTELTDSGVLIRTVAKTNAKTGVEMEALTAASIAALTVYDMCKAVQKDISITNLQLESKTGGKSDYKRA